MDLENYKAFIEDTAIYRGQIVYRWERPAIKSYMSTILLDSPIEFDPYSTFENYYEHQRECISKLRNRNDTLLMAPFNTGRTTICLLYSLDVVFNRQKSVLFISINQFEKDIEKEFLKKVLIQSNYDWLIDIKEIEYDNIDRILQHNNNGTFPSIFIIQAKDLHAFLIPNHNKYSAFIRSLGLIIIDDFEKYSGHPASNLHFVIKRLEILHSIYNSDIDQIQYLITTKPFNESKSVLDSIFERKFEIVHRDDKEINPAYIYFWIPAFSKAEIKYVNKPEINLIRKTVRESLLDDAYILAFESIKRGRKTILYYSGIPFSKNDIKTRERYLHYMKMEKGFDELSFRNNLFMGNDLGELTAEIIRNDLEWDNIDTIIIACISGSVNNIRDDLLHIGNTNAEIFIAMPQIPSYQFYINHPELNILKDIEETVKGEQLSVFVYNLNNVEMRSKHQMFSFHEYLNFNDSEYINNYKRKWGGDFTEIKKHHDSGYSRIKSLKGYDFFSSELDELFEIIDTKGNTVGTVNKSDIPDQYFKNALIHLENQRYCVERLDINNRRIYLSAISRFSLPISLRIFEIKNIEKESNNLEFEDIIFNAKELLVSSSINKYKVIFGTDTDPESFNIISNNIERIENIRLFVIEMTGIQDINSVASIINSSIKTKIIINNLFPRYFTYNNVIYFYNLGTGDLSYFLNDSIIKDLLDRALRILIDCPCKDGCPGCLESYEIENTDFKKHELIELLGRLLKSDEVKDALRWKYEGIGTEDNLREDTVKLREIRSKVFDILKKRAGIMIQNPFDEKFISEDDKKWISESTAGLCHVGNKTMYFRGGYEEAALIDLCAHEYIHNWQVEGNLNSMYYYFDHNDIENENNIWFEGKIFLEGQANWGAAKVMDYFGIREMIFREEVRAYAQYREGLILINELEKRYGLHKLISILKTGSIDNNQDVGTDIINKWYDDTEIKSMIRGLADKKINEGYLRCIHNEYLDKTRDFNRITYFLNHEISPNITESNPLLKDLFQTSNIEENDRKIEKIWQILKDHFKITPKVAFDYLPCKDCAYFEKETVDGMCMLFGSILVKDKIMNAARY